MGKYDDIINLPHHVSKKHPQMSLEARSAQFAPFSQLTGYEEEIEETGRLTNQRKELNEEVKQILDNKLKIIQERISTKPEITCTYFVPDERKDGGKYIQVTGKVIKIDGYNRLIVLEDKTEIPIDEVIEIKGHNL